MDQQQYFYFSLQYSAIQKTVLRHDRLWSIAGMSQILSQLNEIKLPAICSEHGGVTVVAGGGKFTARFLSSKNAEDARDQIIQEIATTLPMLEFQYSEIVEACSLLSARNDKDLIGGLGLKKRKFRGYGVTYHPHLMVCEECGEYPATNATIRKKSVCRICKMAHDARTKLQNIKPDAKLTSIEFVYARYLNKINYSDDPKKLPVHIPGDFENLFPGNSGGNAADTDMIKRMAVWFSDTNNMNTKVPIWFNQEKDDEIMTIFSRLKDINIDIIVDALVEVFPESSWNEIIENDEKTLFLPFRLIVAGGDDLCLVMPEAYILQFTAAISSSLENKMNRIKGETKYDFLDIHWLEKRNEKKETSIGPYCFGASFLITTLHTPFKKIHEAGEHLMNAAKNQTGRRANSVNWQILSTDTEDAGTIQFEKPMFISEKPVCNPGEKVPLPNHLTFNEYRELRSFYKARLSSSQRRNVAKAIIDSDNNPGMCESSLVHAAAREAKAISFLLVDAKFRVNEALDLAKLGTLLELLNIKDGGDNGNK